jgi:hypothetical protein
MWPAEGSVCQPMLPLLAEHGIRWIATDEEVLGGSTQGLVSRDARGHVRDPGRLYRPYRVTEGGAELGIVFRDHALSDLIGFHYQRSQATAAAEDFVGKLRAIGRAVTDRPRALVSVILDGENCWEHYPGGGVDFLRALYERCSRATDIKPVRVGDSLEQEPPRDTLAHLFAGSWISHNFAIWVGHEEDNTAWDALHRAREHLRQREREAPGPPRDALERAWEEIYVAEGSDWFWWYGDDHSSAQDALFDYLFRKHLQNVYLLLGDTPPPELARPISRRGQRAAYTLPRAFLEVAVNGRRTFFEWLSAGRYNPLNEPGGAMAMARKGPIKEVFFGFNVESLFVRVDFEGPARKALADFDTLRLGFAEPAGWELRVRRPARTDQAVELWHRDARVPADGVLVGIDRICELGVPFVRLGLRPDQPLQFFVELLDGRQSRDRAPRAGTINLLVPAPDFEQVMWDV